MEVEIKKTDPNEVDRLWHETQGGFNIIDVRATADFHDCHLPGAVSLPEERWATFEGLSRDRDNVVYCYSPTCPLAHRACELFAAAGFPVQELEGGFDAWVENELGVVREENASEIARDLGNADGGRETGAA